MDTLTLLIVLNSFNQRPNGWRYRQARELAEKATRRRNRFLGLNPTSVGESPHLSGARGVSPRFLFEKVLMVRSQCRYSHIASSKYQFLADKPD